MAQEERAWLQPRQERRLRGKGCVMYVERETVTARGANPNNDTHKVPISHPHQKPWGYLLLDSLLREMDDGCPCVGERVK